MSSDDDPDLTISIVLIPVIVMFTVILFALGLVTIQGPSMVPLLRPDQTVYVNRLAYGLQLPIANIYLFYWDKAKKDDIIVFQSPVDNRLAVKRVVGAAGDSIKIGDAVVLVGGEAYDVPGPTIDRLKRTPIIPDTKVFVVGENRDNSIDSRHYGLVERSRVLGRLISPQIRTRNSG